MQVAPELIFPGAKIRFGEADYTVIKVNAKSFYATTMSFLDFTERWNLRIKGTTFISFCKNNDIKMYHYTDGFEIEETEFNRKKIAEANLKADYSLDQKLKETIIEKINLFKRKKRSVRLLQFDFLNKRVRFLEENGNNYLMNINNDYVLISFDTYECIKISTVYDFQDKYDHIPWEKLSAFAMKEKLA